MKKIFFLHLICFVYANAASNNSDLATSILEFWKFQNNHFGLGSRKDIVLFLGNTGASKSTLVGFLTDADLEAVEIIEDSGNFMVVDRNNLIERVPTILSKTFIPTLFFEPSTGTPYFDCPGFSDTRSAAHDITISYFNNRLLKFANSVKLLFTVNFESVQTGGNRNDFLLLAKNAVTLIRSIDNYRDGIGLMVTKVENIYIRKNGYLHLVDDTKVIETVAHFLIKTRNGLVQIIEEQNLLTNNRNLNVEIIKFIDILLTNRNGQYERIGILRKVDQSGPLRNIPILQLEKDMINTILYEKLQFVPTHSTDFGFTFTTDSKKYLNQLIREVQDHVRADVAAIGNEIEQFYQRQEKEISDIIILHDKMLLAQQKLLEIQTENPRMFLIQIIDVANELGISLSINTLHRFSSKLEYLEFLSEASGYNTTGSLQLTDELKRNTNRIESSRKWYRFLIDLHKEVSKHNLRIDDGASRLIQQYYTIADGRSIDFKQFLNHIAGKVYPNENIMEVNEFKLKKLKGLLNDFVSDNKAKVLTATFVKVL